MDIYCFDLCGIFVVMRIRVVTVENWAHRNAVRRSLHRVAGVEIRHMGLQFSAMQVFDAQLAGACELKSCSKSSIGLIAVYWIVERLYS